MIDRDARKIVFDNGDKHLSGSTALVYLPRLNGGRGMRPVENEYKVYEEKDAAMNVVLQFEERAETLDHQSLVKKAFKHE